MEFREYYRGVCAKIRFDSKTGIYVGELDGLPGVAFLKDRSYENLQAALKQATDDYLAGRKANLARDWPSASSLKQSEIGDKAEELKEEMARISAEMFKSKD